MKHLLQKPGRAGRCRGDKDRQAQGGFTLIELMIAMSLAVTLGLVVLTLWYATTVMLQESFSAVRLNEEIRFLRQIMTTGGYRSGNGWIGGLRYSSGVSHKSTKPSDSSTLIEDDDATNVLTLVGAAQNDAHTVTLDVEDDRLTITGSGDDLTSSTDDDTISSTKLNRNVLCTEAGKPHPRCTADDKNTYIIIDGYVISAVFDNSERQAGSGLMEVDIRLLDANELRHAESQITPASNTYQLLLPIY